MTENRRKRKLTDGESPRTVEQETETNNSSQKTSTEILNELFEAFGAEEFPSDENFESESKKSKKDKKKKKEKHKHKHKEKEKSRERSRDKDRDRDKEKHKKRDRKSSSEVSSRRVSLGDDQQSLGVKVEIIKEKSKEKSPVRKVKEPTPEPVKVPDQIPVEDVPLPRLENGTSESCEKKEKSPELPSIVPKPTSQEETTQIFEKGVIPKPPTIGVLVGPAKGRIQIKSLKTSAVFEQTIREVEEEARKRAEKFEEGELTPSSSSHGRDSTTPSLSDLEMPPRQPSPPPLPCPPLVVEVVQEKTKSKEEGKGGEEKKARRSHGRKSKDKDKEVKHRDKSRSRSRERKGKEGKRHRGSSRERHREHSRERDAKRGERRRSSRERGRRPREEAGGRHRSRSRERGEREKRGGRRAPSRERGDRRGRRTDALGPRTRERPEDGERIDKRKLLAIARRNAMYLLREQQERMIQAGVLPGDSNLAVASADGQGGKTVAELTEYCKQLVKSVSGSSDDDSDISLSDGEGPTESFIHHPFTLKDRPNAIIMNIRNSTQLPTRSLQEKAAETSKIRSLQFPVSSGQQHRSSAEWVPVSPKKAEAASDHTPPAPNSPAPKSKPTPPPENQIVDIGSIISQKLSAMRKMQESAAASSSSSKMLTPDYGYGYGFNQPQPGVQVGWESGEFTGSTGARMLTPAELASGQQAWARKDQLKCAAPVAGGMGMKLLQKMGWRPGEGLGKNKEGGLEPLKLDVKMDKKGLVAQEEVRQRYQPYGGSKKKGGGGGVVAQGVVGQGASPAPVPIGGGEIFSGKHPVSVLVELCTKRHWNSPSFDVVFESGPDHKKNFVFKVHVNGKDYQPQVACGNKKQAKAMAAQHCLQELGLIVKM